jgi:hypothetical protein
MPTDIAFKQKVHNCCLQIIADRLDALELKLQSLSESVSNETKSSMGDKYETTRAMLHIEQDQVRAQKAGLLVQRAVLNSIDLSVKRERISLGTLARIQNNYYYYYLSIALGKIQVESVLVFALSAQSPLGANLKGLTVGDELNIQERKLLISEVI